MIEENASLQNLYKKSCLNTATSSHFSIPTALLLIGVFDKTVEQGSSSIHILQVRPV